MLVYFATAYSYIRISLESLGLSCLISFSIVIHFSRICVHCSHWLNQSTLWLLHLLHWLRVRVCEPYAFAFRITHSLKSSVIIAIIGLLALLEWFTYIVAIVHRGLGLQCNVIHIIVSLLVPFWHLLFCHSCLGLRCDLIAFYTSKWFSYSVSFLMKVPLFQ